MELESRLNVVRLAMANRYKLESSMVAGCKFTVTDEDGMTAATDCVSKIMFGRAFCDSLSDNALMFVMGHEAYHVGFCDHHTMLNVAYPQLMNMALDFRNNAILLSRGMTHEGMASMTIADVLNRIAGVDSGTGSKASGICVDLSYDLGMSTTKLYQRFVDAIPPDTKDAGCTGGVMSGDIQPDPEKETPEHRAAEHAKAQKAVARGAVAERAAAKQRGEELDAFTKRLISDSMKPKVPLAQRLRPKLQKVMSKDDWSRRRPSRSGLRRGVIASSLHSEKVGRIGCVVDTSGSVSNIELSQYAADIGSVVRTLNPESVRVAYCDTQVRSDQTFRRGQKIELKPSGGGGTDFVPGFEWADAQNLEALVYFTDGYGRFPDKAPRYPVIWVVVDGLGKLAFPFGDVLEASVRGSA